MSVINWIDIIDFLYYYGIIKSALYHGGGLWHASGANTVDFLTVRSSGGPSCYSFSP